MFEKIMLTVGTLTTIVVVASALVLGGRWLWESWVTRQSKINKIELKVHDKRLGNLESRLGKLENRLKEKSNDIHK